VGALLSAIFGGWGRVVFSGSEFPVRFAFLRSFTIWLLRSSVVSDPFWYIDLIVIPPIENRDEWGTHGLVVVGRKA
jgi:hypothetical protein